MHTSECLTERRTVFLQIEILRHSYCRHLSPSLYLILSKLFPKTLHTSWIHGANEHDLRSHSIPPDSSTHGYVMDMQIPFFMTVRTRKQNKTNNAVITTNGSQTRKRTLPKKKETKGHSSDMLQILPTEMEKRSRWSDSHLFVKAS
jgi:hypothetical protein